MADSLTEHVFGGQICNRDVFCWLFQLDDEPTLYLEKMGGNHHFHPFETGPSFSIFLSLQQVAFKISSAEGRSAALMAQQLSIKPLQGWTAQGMMDRFTNPLGTTISVGR